MVATRLTAGEVGAVRVLRRVEEVAAPVLVYLGHKAANAGVGLDLVWDPRGLEEVEGLAGKKLRLRVIDEVAVELEPADQRAVAVFAGQQLTVAGTVALGMVTAAEEARDALADLTLIGRFVLAQSENVVGRMATGALLDPMVGRRRVLFQVLIGGRLRAEVEVAGLVEMAIDTLYWIQRSEAFLHLRRVSVVTSRAGGGRRRQHPPTTGSPGHLVPGQQQTVPWRSRLENVY